MQLFRCKLVVSSCVPRKKGTALNVFYRTKHAASRDGVSGPGC
jgi:hypothetical protein